jgi:hypothetical protein
MMIRLLEKIPSDEIVAIKERAFEIMTSPDTF